MFKTKNLALVLAAALAFGIGLNLGGPAYAQDQKEAPKKMAKDQAEVDLIQKVAAEKDAKKKLEYLDKWTKDYPDTAFGPERQQEYLNTYAAAGDCRGVTRIAGELRKADPNNIEALRQTIACIYQIKDANDADYNAAQEAADYMVAHANEVFAESKKPAGVSQANWDTLKTQMVAAGKHLRPYIDAQKKDLAKEEADLKAMLQSDPNDVASSMTLAKLLFDQRNEKTEDVPPAIFEYARVGAYDGPGALDAKTRQAANNAAQNYYKQYHGSLEGWEQIAAAAKTNALPPADFHIKSIVEIAKDEADKQAAADAADPVAAIWRTLKEGLTGDSSDAFFASAKDSGIPSTDGSKKFKAILVSQKPTLTAKTLVMNYRDKAGDIILQLETPLRGKMEPGAELEFYGTLDAFNKSPYSITLKIDDPKTQITGWKPVAAPPAPKKAGGAVKKQAQK